MSRHPLPSLAPTAAAAAAASAIVASLRAEVEAHPGVAGLRAFGRHVAAHGLAPALARAFIASLYYFNRATPAGIAGLAARWADALAVVDPFTAPVHAALVLEAAVDELGLAGTRPHVVIFADFGAALGVSRAELLDPNNAVPAALDIGERVERWYRAAPINEALAVHFVSEETSNAEFADWLPRWPDAEYVRIHAQLEPGHSHHAGDALAFHLALHPEDADLARATVLDYLARYDAMWRELLARVA